MKSQSDWKRQPVQSTNCHCFRSKGLVIRNATIFYAKLGKSKIGACLGRGALFSIVHPKMILAAAISHLVPMSGAKATAVQTRSRLPGRLWTSQGVWTAAGSEAPRRFGSSLRNRKAVSPLRSATAVPKYLVAATPRCVLLLLDVFVSFRVFRGLNRKTFGSIFERVPSDWAWTCRRSV